MVFVNSAKDEAKAVIRKSLGILIDTPTSGGGNTNNRIVAEQFLLPDNREVVCSLIKNTEDKENFRILLRDLNIMLSVCLSTKLGINTLKLKQFGIDIMVH